MAKKSSPPRPPTKPPSQASGKKDAIPEAAPTQPPPPAQEEGALCPLVAFGASAGGLEAFQEVLRAFPDDTGIAMVFVQHLDPRHRSILTELLARSTNMTVVEATEGMAIRPDHVYVIPPNAAMTVARGLLHLSPRPGGTHTHMPIDEFMRSLAADQGGKSIGVVLSGTASDGTLGLKAIKAEGGITFAQDGTAKFDAMPRNAISAGYVDMVLPPAGIAHELARLCKHPYVAEPEPEPVVEAAPTTASHFREIFSLLRASTGVDFTLYKHGTLQRRILRRMALNKFETEEQYARHLKENRTELKELFQDILISVTGFFREPATFEGMAKLVFPVIFRDREADDPVRVWVPGCSTGEDVYSLAIALVEYMRENSLEVPLQIFGTDLSDAALDRARAGTYPESAAADISPERLRRFFVRTEGRYQITRSIRDMCVFASQNLLKDPPFSKLDLICCRNVLIYLGPIVQAKVLQLFHYGLKPSGFLVLGLSETTGTTNELYLPMERRLRIYARRPGLTTIHHLDIRGYEALPIEGMPPEAAHNVPDADLQRRVDQLILSKYSPAGVLVDEDMNILQFHGHTSPYLEHNSGEPNLNLALMLRSELVPEMKKAFLRARKKAAPARSEQVSFSYLERLRTARITVSPVSVTGRREPRYLVLFEEILAPEPKAAAGGGKKLAGTARRVKELEEELTSTKHYLESVIEEQQATTEELKSANEEVQSSNEELQSTNEELLTAKEELQSTNEELTTLNEEMIGRNSELTQVNNDLNNLLTSVNIPIVMLGSDLRIRRFTPQAEKVLNLLPADIGRPVSDFRPKIDLPDLESLFVDAIEHLRISEREVQDRGGRSYNLWVRPYRTFDGKIDGAVMVLLDITERKQAAEARYRRLFEAAKDGILLASAENGTVIDLNPYLIRNFGISRPDAIGRRYWEMDLFRGSGLDEDSFREVLRNETIFRGVTLVNESGERFDVEAIGNVYLEGERRIIQLNIRDVTERKRSEERGRRQGELSRQSQYLDVVGRMAGSVAHDFNNLLTAIIGYADLLKMRVSPDDPVHNEIAKVGRAAERATVLTRQLLVAGRKPAPRPEVLDLSRVLEASEQMLRVTLANDINLEIRTGKIRPIKVDRSQIEQVIFELAVNAREAMSAGSTLTLETFDCDVDEAFAREHPAVPAGSYVCLTVSETGAAPAAKLSEGPFPLSLTRANGAGLSAIHAILQQYGGYVWAFSELGRGTVFRIYLPPSPEPLLSAGPTAAAPLARGSEKILLVEDDEIVRRLSAQILRQAGYEVIEANEGAEALRLFAERDGNPDLLLAEVVLPQMSGREVADRLISQHPGMRVLYMSGHPLPTIEHHGVLEPDVNFIAKPFAPEAILRRVRDVLDDGAHSEQS